MWFCSIGLWLCGGEGEGEGESGGQSGGGSREKSHVWQVFDFASLFSTSSTSRAHFDGTVIIASSLEISEVHRILSVENFNSRLKCFRSAWMARLHRTTKGKVWFASNPEIYEYSESKALATRGRRHLVRRSTPPMPCTKNTPVTATSSVSHVPHNESTENSETKNNIHQCMYVCLSIYLSIFLSNKLAWPSRFWSGGVLPAI